MNKKKLIIIVVSGFVVLLAAILIYSNIHLKTVGSDSRKSEIKIVDVDKIVENPEKYSGIVNVEGTIIEIIDNNKMFTLGCEDACVVLPVSYKGEMPKLKSNIIALGEVKKDNAGKYFFEAKEFKYK